MKDGAVYEDMVDFKALKKYMEDQLEDYNMEPGVIAMDLVLFRDAIEHGKTVKGEPFSSLPLISLVFIHHFCITLSFVCLKVNILLYNILRF